MEVWDKELQGHALSAFFYGHLLTPILAGYMSDRFGGKFGTVFGVFVISTCSILLPISLRIHSGFVFAIRIIQGLMSGLAIPSIYKMFGVWASPMERATLMAVVLSAEALASVINPPLSGYLCSTANGWPMIFYAPGIAGVILTIFLYFCVFSKPSDHPSISQEEKDYLMRFQSIKSSQTKTPWRELLKNGPFHVLWMTHVAFNWCLYLTSNNLPLFIRDVFDSDIDTVALYSFIPYIGQFIFGPIAGKLYDVLSHKNFLSKTNLRKTFNSIGFLVPSACIFLLWIICEDNINATILMITMTMSFLQSAHMGGFFLSHNDLFGQHAGLVFGITNTLAQIPGFVTSILVAYLTPNGTRHEWLQVYSISGGICLFGGLIYLWWGTSELQPWAANKDSSVEETDLEMSDWDSEIFAEKEDPYSLSAQMWPSIKKENGRILFINTITQPNYSRHNELMY